MEAETEYSQVLELDENFAGAYVFLSALRWEQGRMEEAVAFSEKAYTLTPWVPQVIGAHAGLLMRLGEKSRAQDLLAKIGDGQNYGAQISLVVFHFLQGDIDRVIDWLDKAIEQRHPFAPGFAIGPIGMALRSSPLWASVAKRLNLPN